MNTFQFVFAMKLQISFPSKLEPRQFYSERKKTYDENIKKKRI